MIFVIATIEIEAGRREDFLEEFHKIVPDVHAEDGCLEYGPTVDLETTIDAQPDAREPEESVEVAGVHEVVADQPEGEGA